MTESSTPHKRTRSLVASITASEHAEFVRLASLRHGTTPGKQVQQVVRDWIAAEQAAEASEAAEKSAA